jgi:hypothetical protein
MDKEGSLQSPPWAHHARHYLFMAAIIRRDPWNEVPIACLCCLHCCSPKKEVLIWKLYLLCIHTCTYF